jgi:hypothetical protein
MKKRSVLSFLVLALSFMIFFQNDASSQPVAQDQGHRHVTRFPHFIPNSQEFWDFSKNWTTNFGPAYRDTVLKPSNLVPCTGQYALCFSSGPPPLPCRVTKDGRFANCECTVQTGRNYVLITSILNYKVYQDTIDVCGTDGSGCTGQPDKAPVCKAIAEGRLIPGADVISTYSPNVQSSLVTIHDQAPNGSDLTICPKGPYAGCMTAPCKKTRSGRAVCSCPIFWGPFQLVQSNAQCTLGGKLVWSASYDPIVDALP